MQGEKLASIIAVVLFDEPSARDSFLLDVNIGNNAAVFVRHPDKSVDLIFRGDDFPCEQLISDDDFLSSLANQGFTRQTVTSLLTKRTTQLVVDDGEE